MRSGIKIFITHFPGSVEYCHAKRNGTLIQCAVLGCNEQVLFHNPEADDYVCFLHGQLTLRRQWSEWGTMMLEANIVEPPEKCDETQMKLDTGPESVE